MIFIYARKLLCNHLFHVQETHNCNNMEKRNFSVRSVNRVHAERK